LVVALTKAVVADLALGVDEYNAGQ
jgi:hypothetical protein